ncbi:MAG: PIG-L family deacetylase, partial [Actinomycetota bacterium]|nr:PIG-L family deacetylase [Actinomycetota bacterium]
MKVLAIGAHPDDIELICAGTMAKFKKQGAEVFLCHVC